MSDEKVLMIREKFPHDFERVVNEILKEGGWRIAETEMSECDHQYVAMLIREKIEIKEVSND